MITHVAIRDVNGKVWALPNPNRHHNVIHEICVVAGSKEAGRNLLREHVQGFLNDTGEFITRKEAFFEALRCEQLLPPYNPVDTSQRRGEVNTEPRELFSEDLW